MSTAVPAPVLDDRNEDQIAAEAIGALPSELSDRSDSNPAVVVIEAAAYVVGRYLYQLNRWPAAVVQKALALIGVTMRAAVAATVTQRFAVANPQAADITIATGTEVSTSDGSIVFATTEDATIPAYISGAGTVSTTAGVTTVTGAGTAFILGTTMVGWGIQIPATTGTWYTIASVTDATHLELTVAATATVAGAAWYTGPQSITAPAAATLGGADTSVGAATLTTMVSGVSGVATTTNPAAATGGLDAETTAEAIARAPTAFATRDVACTASDYAEFAQRILGSGSRAQAKENYNINAPTQGYVSVALLSPSWTVGTPVSASERKSVLADLQARRFFGATTIDLPATIYQPTPAAIVWRKASTDATTVRVNVAGQFNTYLAPSTYPWGRILYTADLADEVEAAAGVDRVHVVDGIACVGRDGGRARRRSRSCSATPPLTRRLPPASSPTEP